jgi:hypothetical protein
MKAHRRVEATSQRRHPRRLKEIILAVFLTAAAVGFIAAAMLREEVSPGTPSLEAARKPFPDPSR